jgi:hypothetical protein
MITQRIQSWCIDVNTVIASKLTHRCQAFDTELGCFSVYSKLKGSVLSHLNGETSVVPIYQKKKNTVNDGVKCRVRDNVNCTFSHFRR